MFTMLKLDPKQIAQWHAGAVSTLGQSLPGAQFDSHAAMVVATRLRNYPECYLEFGPYWWAVKAALASLGPDFGPAQDDLVRSEYGGGLSAGEAIVAGELFKDHYRVTYLAGACTFTLHEDGGTYLLYDADMEARRLGRGAAAVSANLTATPEAA